MRVVSEVVRRYTDLRLDAAVVDADVLGVVPVNFGEDGIGERGTYTAVLSW